MDLIPKQYQKPVFWGLGIAGGLLLLSLYRKGVAGTTAEIVKGGVHAIGDVAAGVVTGAGQVIGVPATNTDQCAKDMARGDNWAASFSCDASTFLAWQAKGIGYNLDKLKGLL